MANDIGYIKESLSRVEKTLDEQRAMFALRTDVANLDTRIKDLESWKYKAMGAAAALGVASSFLKDAIFR